MIATNETLRYIVRTVGKPIVAIYNDIENKWYYFLSDTFTPANPSNHIHDNNVNGRNLESILTGIQGFSHGVNAAAEGTTLNTKVNELPLEKYTFTRFRWIWIQM